MHIYRTISELLAKKMHSGKAIVLIGARQVGKTTLLKEYLQKHDHVLWLNGDKIEIRALMDNITVERYRSMLENNDIVVIDEAQRISDIGLKCKLLTDNFPDVQLIVTGSSSLDLANKVNEPLTGRKWEYRLFPLSYAELSAHFGAMLEWERLPLRLVYGSYPDVVCNPGSEREVLNNLTDSYLYKDILVWDRIKRPDKVVRLLQALAYQVGSEVSTNELSRMVELDRSTVEKYINLLEQAQVIFRLGAFSRNLRTEIKSSRKIYFYDNGVRNALIGNLSPVDLRPDIGALWENYMVSELLKKNSYDLTYAKSYFWRTTQQQEIDYIEEYDGQMKAYEFKWNPTKKVKVSKTFRDAYPDVQVQTITRENYMEFLKPQSIL
ncbi:MAG: ATP-binding protein [Bacteroidales bacterium]|nr:ATP-binding protein [Bacteroidales bacterium]